MHNLAKVQGNLRDFQTDPRVTVLAVDDEPENLALLESMLGSMHVEVVKARSGEQALKHLLDKDIALILMDVQMPGLDGFETAVLIRQRERTRNVPIVFLTRTYKAHMNMKGYALEQVDYLLKPVVPEVLRAKVSVYIELSKRRKEQARSDSEQADYRLLFEKSPCPMWVLDASTLAFVAVNEAAVRHYGYSREEFLKMTVKDIRTSEEIGTQAGGIWRHKKKDASIVAMETAYQDLSFGGRPCRLVFATDITERKNIEAQLFRTQRMESIGTLAGGIAHDLNNVLAPILMGLQLLRDRFKDNPSQALIETMETSAKRGADIIRQVLTFARGLGGEHGLVQPKHLLGNIVKMLQQTFPKSIELQAGIPGNLWPVRADPTQLDQMLLNLSVNARDAMPQGGKLTINAENTFLDENYVRLNVHAKAGPYIVIEVSDTGHGMPPEIMDKIFEPFFTTKEVGEGTGLGLSTVQSIVKSHGGFVNVYSEVGKGTAFKVFLPAKESAETREAAAHQSELPLGAGQLILIVDDEAAVRDIAQVTLESYNYSVLTAKDGAEALALYAQHQEKVQAILLDMMMPVLDGPNTIRALETINPKIKIIAASGLLTNDTSSRSVRAVLTKPYTAEKLLKTLAEVLAERVEN